LKAANTEPEPGGGGGVTDGVVCVAGAAGEVTTGFVLSVGDWVFAGARLVLVLRGRAVLVVDEFVF
jgi:hypothetical protein